MSVYGGTFIWAPGDPEPAWSHVIRSIEEWKAEWLGSSPEHHACEYTVAIADDKPWITIDNSLPEGMLARISSNLSTDAIDVGMVDEMYLSFYYQHFTNGVVVRALNYGGVNRRPYVWNRPDGKPEAWEQCLFPDGSSRNLVVIGASTPSVCDPDVLGRIMRRLDLPWDCERACPAPSMRSVAIPGYPPRKTRTRPARPWWRFW